MKHLIRTEQSCPTTASCSSNIGHLLCLTLPQLLIEIPIHECGEQLVDLRRIRCHRIQMLPDPTTPFEAAWCNSGLPCASKMRFSIIPKLQKMTAALDELASLFGYESGQVDIKIFEALRDLETQKMLFDKKVSELVHSNPDLSVDEAEREAAKWVSPYKNNVPVHSTGAAVDIRLWDNKRERFLDMGTFGVIWGTNASANSRKFRSLRRVKAPGFDRS